MTKSRFGFWALSATVLLVLMLMSVFVGTVHIPLSNIFSGNLSELERVILWESRFPRTIVAVLAGAGLAAAGLVMQTLFRNPLAGPSVLGVSSGASLMVAVVTLGSFGLASSPNVQMIAAIAGSLLVLLLILWAANRFADIATVLIIGLMLSFFTSSIVSLLQAFASESQIKAFIFWGFGSFAGLGSDQLIYLTVPILVALLASPFLIKGLNSLLLGEMHATSMGVNVKQLKLGAILFSGVVAGTVTAFCGPIAFLGLATPHIVRLFFKSNDHRIILPGSILGGSSIALFCDLIARLPGTDMAIPLNSVCAFMGAPVVIYLILKGRKSRMLI